MEPNKNIIVVLGFLQKKPVSEWTHLDNIESGCGEQLNHVESRQAVGELVEKKLIDYDRPGLCYKINSKGRQYLSEHLTW